MSASPEAIAAIWEVAEVIFSSASVRRARLVLDELGHSQNHNLGTLRDISALRSFQSSDLLLRRRLAALVGGLGH
jgi:hypothetical protein